MCQQHATSVPANVSVHLPDVQAWRSDKFFDNVFNLVGVPVITVQLRYDGWVTEMQVGARGALEVAGEEGAGGADGSGVGTEGQVPHR